MANTKPLSRPERRVAKRNQRRELKKLYASLDKSQRARLREDKVGIKAMLAQIEKEAADG